MTSFIVNDNSNFLLEQLLTNVSSRSFHANSLVRVVVSKEFYNQFNPFKASLAGKELSGFTVKLVRTTNYDSWDQEQIRFKVEPIVLKDGSRTGVPFDFILQESSHEPLTGFEGNALSMVNKGYATICGTFFAGSIFIEVYDPSAPSNSDVSSLTTSVMLIVPSETEQPELLASLFEGASSMQELDELYRTLL